MILEQEQWNNLRPSLSRLKEDTMGTDRIFIKDIPETMCLHDVIRMLLQSPVTDISQYVLFYVKGRKEKRIKSIHKLRELLSNSPDNVVLAVKKRVRTTKSRSVTLLKAKKTIMRMKSMFVRRNGKPRNSSDKTTEMTHCNKMDKLQSATPQLTQLENLILAEAISELQKVEPNGRTEVFSRVVKDIVESMKERLENKQSDLDTSKVSYCYTTLLPYACSEAYIRRSEVDSDLDYTEINTSMLQDDTSTSLYTREDIVMDHGLSFTKDNNVLDPYVRVKRKCRPITGDMFPCSVDMFTEHTCIDAINESYCLVR